MLAVRSALAPLLLALSLVPLAASAAGSIVIARQTVGPYRLVLEVGPAQKMGMQSTKAGQRMVGGKAAVCSAVGALGSGATCNHNVALHVYTRKGRVVTTARVTITLRNQQTHRATRVRIAELTGASVTSDFHYGNNIRLPSGNYSVDVRVNNTVATFRVHIV
jgi:hypothetical protein